MSDKNTKTTEDKIAVVGDLHVLTAAEIFDNDALPVQWVSTPEWSKGNNPNAGFYIRGLTGLERDRYESSMIKGRGKKRDVNLENARAKLVALCAINGPDPDHAQRVFNLGQVKKLGQMSVLPLQRAFEVAQKLSGLTDDQIDELTENLDQTQGDGFG